MRVINMKKNILSISVIAIVLLTSCTNFLDIKPYGKTIPKTPDEFASLLHTYLYKIDQGESDIFTDTPSIINYECYADNLDANLTSYPKGDFIPLYIGSHLSNMQHLYERLYAIIRDCNIILDNLKEDGSALTSNVLGTAYAIRGMCYFNLLRNFCEPAVNNTSGEGVPLVASFNMEDKPVRNTIEETIRFIESDYKKALEYNINDEVYIFNNDVINALLSRLYFWVGDWSNAIVYSKKVLDKFPLLAGKEYEDMIRSSVTKKGNMIFKSGGIFNSGQEMSNLSSIETAKDSRPLSRKFVGLFKEGEKDIRYSLTIGSTRKFAKMPLSCIRSAEMQLIVAESLYHLGDKNGALKTLNELRSKRIKSYKYLTEADLQSPDPESLIKVDATGKQLTPLLSAILNERTKELFMEDDRWYELKRNGCPEFWVAKQGRKYTTFKFMYTFPLPIMDIFLVKGLVQNPGYNKVG